MANEASSPGVAVWGVGSHARRNAIPALARCPDLRLVGLMTRAKHVLEEQAARFGCEAWSSPEAMLGSPDVQAVYLATPTGLHHEHGLQVLRSGRHLWCEKALTDSLKGSAELVATSEERDLALCEAFMYMHHPQFQRIREWIEDGAIGKLRSITARFGFPHLDPANVRYVQELGGGALLDVGVYPLSVALAISEEAPRGVHAYLDRDERFSVDTAGSALLRFPSGVHALLDWGYGRAYRNEFEVWGEGGTIFAERAFSKPSDLSPPLKLRRQDGEVLEEGIEPTDHFVKMFSAFAATLNDAALRTEYRARALRQARLVSSVMESAL